MKSKKTIYLVITLFLFLFLFLFLNFYKDFSYSNENKQIDPSNQLINSSDLNLVWLAQAEKDLEMAEKLYESEQYYLVAFLCQQSVEKALKNLGYSAKNDLKKECTKL